MPRRGTPSTRKPGSSGSMRRGERAVVIAGVSILVLVALWGALSAPGSDSNDRRLSTYLAGPSGAKGLAQALRRLGVTVQQRRRPYFDIATDSSRGDRKSTRLNSSHGYISYAVFCLKKKKKINIRS